MEWSFNVKSENEAILVLERGSLIETLRCGSARIQYLYRRLGRQRTRKAVDHPFRCLFSSKSCLMTASMATKKGTKPLYFQVPGEHLPGSVVPLPYGSILDARRNFL